MDNNLEFQNISNYLDKYWEKYPNEKSNDPSKEDIEAWINRGGSFFLKENILILYTLCNELAEIVFYWCDMKDIPKEKLKNTLKNHKKFIRSLKVPTYSKAIKELFNRNYLIHFNKETNLWRWI